MRFLKTLILLSISFLFAACQVSVKPSTLEYSRGVNSNENVQTDVGGVDGGGGKGIVCRDAQGVIQSAELLDLYEGKSMYGLNIRKSDLPIQEQVNKALQVIPATSRSLFEVFADIVIRKMVLLPSGTKLLPVDDSFEIILPKGCEAEQVAHYYSDDRILVDRDIWDHMSETDKSALILHEAVYRVNRAMGAKDSRGSRHTVMHLFDPATQWTDVNEGVPETALNCISMKNGTLSAWAYKNSQGFWVLQFQILGKSLLVSKKTIWIPRLNIGTPQEINFDEAKLSTIRRGNDLVGTSTSIAGSLQSSFENDDILTITKRWESLENGNQAPRYYLSWRSQTFPNLSANEQLLNCGVSLPKK
ncbi:hypothetical protein [Bdellovibrio bacteriovorus]|uniref:hypothetical protein n=1 Tax=Bdellovibrio TaxID=958 RepID=UPI0035A8D00A